MSKRMGIEPTSIDRFGIFEVRTVADLPREILPAVRRCLTLVEPYAPRWLRSVRVMFDTPGEASGDTAVLEIESSYEYQSATIHVYAPWLDLDDRARYEAFVHEFGHALTEPLRHELCTACDVLAPDGDPGKKEVRDLLLYNIKRAQETVAEDIKHALLAAERKRGAR